MAHNNSQQISELEEKAREIRRRTITSLYHAQAGHPGPSLSWADIAATLFFNEMNLSVNDGERDRFILSKGHGVATLYSAISIFNPSYVSEQQLKSLRQLGSPLQGHPVRGTLPLIDASTGSLGQGLSIGIGYALGMKLKKNNHRKVYVVLGDGECQEGQIWEAFMSAPKFRLNNLATIIDYNKFQNEAAVKDTMPLESLVQKLVYFGWHVQEIDGHSIDGLLTAYENARAAPLPSAIIAHTIKGKGVSFMEGNMDWHSRVIKQDEYEKAMKELS